jgi:phosphoglycolate phosphatase
VPPARCVVVGDAVDDMRIATAAGMAGYGVDFGVASRSELAQAGARAVFSSIDQLGDVLTPRRPHVHTV